MLDDGRRVVLAVASVVAAATLAWAAWALRVPAVERWRTENPATTAFMLSREAGRDGAVPGPAPRWVPLEAVSPLLVCATIHSEDPRFFEHDGVDWISARYAALLYWRGGPLKGASTLAMQLARNLYLSPRRTLTRKLREVVIAKRLERTLGKRRVLELYLNLVEFGEGVWGVGVASRRYFGKDAARLDAFESAFLVSLLPAPRQPLEGVNLERAYSVQQVSLRILERSGLLEPQAARASTERLTRLREALRDGRPLARALGPPGNGPATSLATPWTVDELLGLRCRP